MTKDELDKEASEYALLIAELKEKLTKAKEIIKDLLVELDDLSELSGMSYKSKLKEQAKQFLKEVSE